MPVPPAAQATTGLPGLAGLPGLPGLLDRLRAALDGSGPALLPLPVDPASARRLRAAARPQEPVDDGTALVLATSGSTGEAKAVEIGAAALTASARATAARLSRSPGTGGPGSEFLGSGGQWLLALPLEHVAAWQVMVRSVVAGTSPVPAPPGDPAALPAAVAAMRDDVPRYAALVPTQLLRALAHPGAAAALARLDAVLLGGAAASSPLLARARDAGVTVVRTYGATETSGGCVYDGFPLDGVDVALDTSQGYEGRVLLAGPVLATGYRGRPDLTAQAFPERGGQRWFATSDLGGLAPDGRLSVLGRLDDVIVSGGRKVAPLAVERMLSGLPGVAEVLVVGVPDREWGQRVVALVVVTPGAALPPLEEARAVVSDRLGAACAPRALLGVAALPTRGPGKPDRRAAAALAAVLVSP